MTRESPNGSSVEAVVKARIAQAQQPKPTPKPVEGKK
jgi:hypothetical protein